MISTLGGPTMMLVPFIVSVPLIVRSWPTPSFRPAPSVRLFTIWTAVWSSGSVTTPVDGILPSLDEDGRVVGACWFEFSKPPLVFPVGVKFWPRQTLFLSPNQPPPVRVAVMVRPAPDGATVTLCESVPPLKAEDVMGV